MIPRLALSLLLVALPALAAPPSSQEAAPLEAVSVHELPGPPTQRRLHLSFPSLTARADLERLSTSEALAFASELESSFAAQTQQQLEAVAERFGKALGGVGLRVLMTVAAARLAKALPEVPRGGAWSRLSPARLSLPGGGGRGGWVLVEGARAEVSISTGTVVLMGVSTSATASAVAATAASARTSGDCRDASDKGEAKRHHIATDKNDLSESSGGPWTPQFRDFFAKADMSLDDPANIVHLIGHAGPHPQAYHQAIADRIEAALGRCRSPAECRARLVEELDRIAADICKRGSVFNNLLTKRP